jgi:AraC family transcriptional regulator
VNAPASSTSEWGITKSKTITGFSIKEFSQPPQRRLPWHEHPDASICFVVSGSYTEQAGGRDQECTPHSMVFKPAAQRHADQFGRLGGKCLLIEINPGRLDTIAPFSSILAKPSLVRNARLAALGHNIHREFVGGDAFSPLSIEGLILEVLVEASRAVLDEPATVRPAWLRQAHELIHDDFCESLTLSSLARAVGVHPSHLARTFRKHYRRSIGDYVRRLRIERAARELTETSAPLGEIGLRFGFFDQSHFARVFKSHTGQTPAQFRAASRGRNSRTNPHSAS